MMTSF